MDKKTALPSGVTVSKIIAFAVAVIITAALLIIPAPAESYTSVSTEGISYRRAKVTAILSEDGMKISSVSSQVVGRQTLEAVSGGETYTVINNLSDTHNIRVSVGSRIIVCADEPENAEPYYTVFNYDRTVTIALMLAAFLLLTVLVGGVGGFFSAFAIGFSVVLLLRFTIPVVFSGGSLILTLCATILAITAVTTAMIDGFTLKGITSAAVTVFGELCACLAFLAMSGALHISGFVAENVDSLLVISNATGMEISPLLLACTAISSLGAVMDVAVSLVSAIWEISRRNPSLTRRQLAASGMTVGRDMIGTMSNTLILAFAGSAFTAMLVFCSYGVQPEQLFNSDYLACELANGLAGTAAVILTVPIASVCAAAVITKFRSHKKQVF